MAEVPLLAMVAGLTADPRFALALAIAAICGLVRGFAGFGSALIYIPLVSAIYGPQIAAPTFLIFDTICSLPFALRAFPQCNRREVGLVCLTAAPTIPVGVTALLFVDPLILRWLIAGMVLLAIGVLAAGWRYRGRPTAPAALGVGVAAGFGAGAVQLGTPPLLLFWLGGQNDPVTVRANIMVYYVVQGAVSAALYTYSGLFNQHIVAMAAVLCVPFAAAVATGAYWFHGAGGGFYRRVAYVFIALAGILSLPIFDKIAERL